MNGIEPGNWRDVCKLSRMTVAILRVRLRLRDLRESIRMEDNLRALKRCSKTSNSDRRKRLTGPHAFGRGGYLHYYRR